MQFNGYSFFVEELGKGECILFVHGSACDSGTWSKCAKKLSDSFHTISYSRRFHRPNEKISPGQDYSMKQHVEDLKFLINEYTDAPVNIVGHSYGALMCLELALHNPELINRMILSEPPAIRLFVSNVPKPAEIISLLFRRPMTAISIIKLGAMGLGPATKAAEKGEMKKAMEFFGKAALGLETFSRMSNSRRETVLKNLTASELTGSGFLPLIEDELRGVKMPILLLTGERSPKVFTYLVNRLQELLPNAVHKQIPQSSHIIHEDNEEEFVRAVRSFIN